MVWNRMSEVQAEGIIYGADYNPDQWSSDIWEEDIALMRRAGVNLVSLPVFSWSKLEPRPGEYQFEWLDHIIDLIWKSGISIDLATATATPPSWMVRRHPEMLPENSEGTRLAFGSRQAYCPSSPVWREYVAQMTRTMAERYGRHPGVRLWHVSNEYGDHISRCWCPVSADHFRNWLRLRYGSVDMLNHAWGTTVWGQIYGDFTQIEPPRATSGPVLPTHQLDFERFSSDALLELFRTEVEILREVTPDIPVTTNFMGLFRELNYWDFADLEDIVTNDEYPDPADANAHISAALDYSLMRSLKKGAPWLLLEQAPSAVSWRDVNLAKPPGYMRLMSLQALAHGADGLMFFQWRQARFGPEKFHSAMVGHRGESSRSFRETSSLGQELRKLAPLRGTRVRSSVAIVVDWDSWWGMTEPDSLPSIHLKWLDQIKLFQSAMFTLGQPVDVVEPNGPFSEYGVLIVANQYVVSELQAEPLTAFVDSGGHLVVGPFTGVVDEHEHIHRGGAPGPLRDLLGVEIDEWWPLGSASAETVQTDAREFEVQHWAEWLEPHADTVITGRYVGGPLNGRPAFVEREQGSGRTTYISCQLSSESLADLLSSVLVHAGLVVRSYKSPVEIVTRTNGRTDYSFVLNHGDTSLSVSPPPESKDLLSGTYGKIRLEKYGVAVLAYPTPPHLSGPPVISIETTA